MTVTVCIGVLCVLLVAALVLWIDQGIRRASRDRMLACGRDREGCRQPDGRYAGRLQK